jgi:PelA/Pel-15E family pectate lyase
MVRRAVTAMVMTFTAMLAASGGAVVVHGQPPAPPIAWNSCLRQLVAWYGSAEAIRIGDNVLLYQRRSGGWPKNIDMARVLAPVDVATIRDERELNDSTIDNSSTHTQLRYLARVFEQTKQTRFRDAFGAGLTYLLAAQYPNGGWPQYYPLRTNYSRYITFNDDAMIGVMRLLREIGEARAPYGFVEVATRTRARDAVQRGIALIVKSQIRVGGSLTAWCAQHDEQTLEPRDARSYEHASISGRESVEIVRFLMSIERPAADVVAAIDGAVTYLRSNQVRGLRLVERPDQALPHGRDVVAVADPSAPPLWARFYQIGTNRPVYSGRDGIIKYNLSEIEIERRAGYSWLGPYAADLLDREYPAWKATQK